MGACEGECVQVVSLHTPCPVGGADTVGMWLPEVGTVACIQSLRLPGTKCLLCVL